MKPEGDAQPAERASDAALPTAAAARDEASARTPDEQEAHASPSELMRETEKLRSLGQLAAGVAHDFNNSLAAILGRVQLLLRHATDERQRRDLRVIETAALDAAATVRRIQTFVRRATDEPPRTVAATRLAYDVLQLTRTRWENEAQARGLRYEVEFEPAPDGTDEVSAHPSEVREVLVNLVLNALDAMPEGGRLRIDVRGRGEFVQVGVHDTGPGIPAELRERIFEPFFTTRGAAGSGLGLAVSQSLVGRCGGTIEVESEPGRGTTFTVRLPRVQEARAEHALHETHVPRRRVLVVDDEPAVREVLVEMLTELGQDVSAAESASAALERLACEPFDLLLTDLSMREMDGLRLAAEARRLAPGLMVVLTTGYGPRLPGSLRPDPALVDAVLDKPFQFSDLETTLRALAAQPRTL